MDIEIVAIDSLTPNPENYRQHPPDQIAHLVASLEQYGWARNVVVSADSIILAGHGIVQAARQVGRTEVPIHRLPWPATDPRCRKFMVLENEVSHLAEDDGEQLARLLNDVAEEDPEGLLGTGYDVASLDALIAGLQAEEFGKTIGEVAEGGEDPLLMPEDMVDALFPSDNEWGIPTLDADLQGEHVATPIIKWGTIARASRMQGTWHFYTDDYKFSALWADPTPVINSRCYGAIEPNVSTGPQSPKAYGLWATFQKRWIARYWQSYGLRIFVDLNVEPHLADLNLLGVPRGWRAYATRWPTKDPAIVEHDFAVAAQHAEGKPLFVVYGGGCEAVETCGARGWVHIPERMREIES